MCASSSRGCAEHRFNGSQKKHVTLITGAWMGGGWRPSSENLEKFTYRVIYETRRKRSKHNDEKIPLLS
jgi:hypothetical protein